MIWVAWRRQRTETLISAAVLGLVAAILIPTGIGMAGAYDHDGLSACVGQSPSAGCGNAIQSFLSRYESVGNLTSWFTLLPGLIGVLLAASFVLELENGTHRLGWTQSITRSRWIATKLGALVGVGLLATLALTLLITWWRAPLVRLDGRMENSTFDFEGTVALGYVLFALGLALAVGVVWRRAVPAIAVAFVGYVATRFFVDSWLRQRFEAPLTATWRESPIGPGRIARGDGPPPNLSHAWVIDQFPSDKLGHAVQFLAGPCGRFGGGATRSIDKHCLVQRVAVYSHAIYQPASRFWAFQGIETALFGGLALVLIAFAAWWTHQRIA